MDVFPSFTIDYRVNCGVTYTEQLGNFILAKAFGNGLSDFLNLLFYKSRGKAWFSKVVGNCMFSIPFACCYFKIRDIIIFFVSIFVINNSVFRKRFYEVFRHKAVDIKPLGDLELTVDPFVVFKREYMSFFATSFILFSAHAAFIRYRVGIILNLFPFFHCIPPIREYITNQCLMVKGFVNG